MFPEHLIEARKEMFESTLPVKTVKPRITNFINLFIFYAFFLVDFKFNSGFPFLCFFNILMKTVYILIG